MATAFFALAIAIMPMVQTSVLTLVPSLAAKLITIGGTGNPTAKNIETLVGGSLVEDRTVQAIYTPQQLAPVNGPLTLHESVVVGTDNVVAWAVVETDQDLSILTISQGSVVVSRAIAHWNSNPANAPPPANLKITLLANPMRPNGGVLARFPGLSLFGIAFYGPTEQSEYQVTDSAFAYDLYATSPLYLNNPLSWINALAGVAVPYDGGYSLHGTDPDYTNPDLDVRTEVYGNTTYHTIIPKNLPMLEPLRAAGLGGFADVIQPLLKVWVDAGYYKNDPAASPGVHMPAQLFMPIDNVIRALVQSPGAILEGLATIPRNLGIVQNQPLQPSYTQDSAIADDDNASNDNKEGDKIVNDSPQPQPPVDTSGQGDGGQPPASSGPNVTLGGDNSGLDLSLNQSSQTPNTDLPKEDPEADKRDELKEDDDESTRLSDSKKDDESDDKKKDGKEDEDSPESKTTKPESPSPPSTAGTNGPGPSGSPSAGNENNDTANAA